MIVNNNTNTTIAPTAGESKPALNPVDKKIQQVSKGFFSSLASFFGKVVKAIVVVATFPVSLPLMYLASKMKKATKTSSEIKQETVVALKEEIKKEPEVVIANPKEEIKEEPEVVIANPKEEIKDSPEDIFEAGRGIFEEARDTPEDIFEAGRGVFEETREPAAIAHANRGSKSSMLKAGLAGLTGLGLAAAAVYYGKDIFTSAPLASVKDIVSNSTAVGFPVQEFSDTGFCGLTCPPTTALALPVETYFDKGVSMKAVIPSMTSALDWAIKNSNTSAPLAPVKDIVSNSTAVRFPVQEFSDTGFCGLTCPPTTALALPVETYFDKGVSMKAVMPPLTSALNWAIQNFNRTHA